MDGARVLVVDDHDVVRAGLRAVAEQLPDTTVVGEASNGREAIELVTRLKPSIVLIDVTMPELNGLEATRQIREISPDTRVIAISMHGSQHYIAEMLRAGASGYLLKNSAGLYLAAAVAAVRAGKVFLAPEVADVVVENYVKVAPDRSKVFEALSSRERQVLQLLAEGKTSKEIAEALFISPKTVETHRAQIMSKLNVHTVAELTKLAVRDGLTPLE